MKTTTNPNRNRLFFWDQADKQAELDRLDDLLSYWTRTPEIAHRFRRSIYLLKARRKKVSGWVVGVRP